MMSEVSEASIEIVRSSGLPAVVTCRFIKELMSYPDSQIWGTKCRCKCSLETAIQTDTLDKEFREWAKLPKGSYWFICRSFCYHDMKREFEKHMDADAHRRMPREYCPNSAYD